MNLIIASKLIVTKKEMQEHFLERKRLKGCNATVKN